MPDDGIFRCIASNSIHILISINDTHLPFLDFVHENHMWVCKCGQYFDHLHLNVYHFGYMCALYM